MSVDFMRLVLIVSLVIALVVASALQRSGNDR
jgi:hypothetical protein